jgi:hypothetical protein
MTLVWDIKYKLKFDFVCLDDSPKFIGASGDNVLCEVIDSDILAGRYYHIFSIKSN